MSKKESVGTILGQIVRIELLEPLAKEGGLYAPLAEQLLAGEWEPPEPCGDDECEMCAELEER